MKTKTLLLIMVLLLASCATKKNTYEFKDHSRFDSINYHQTKLVFPPLKDSIFIKSPCDSLGHLKPFKESFSTPQGKIIIEGKNDHITANIDLKGTSNKETSSTQINKENIIDKSDSTTVIRVTDWRLIIALICSMLLNIGLIYYKFFKS